MVANVQRVSASKAETRVFGIALEAYIRFLDDGTTKWKLTLLAFESRVCCTHVKPIESARRIILPTLPAGEKGKGEDVCSGVTSLESL